MGGLCIKPSTADLLSKAQRVLWEIPNIRGSIVKLSWRLVLLSVTTCIGLIVFSLWFFRSRPTYSLEEVGSFSFTTDGNNFVTTSAKGVEAWSWPGLNASQLLPITSNAPFIPNTVNRFAWSEDGTWFAESYNDQISVWRIPSTLRTDVIQRPNDSNIVSMSFNRDGSVLVVVSLDDIRVWYLSEGSVISTTALTLPPRKIALSPDGQTIATPENGTLQLVNLSDEVVTRILEMPLKHAVNISAIRFSPDGQWLAAAASTEGHPVWVWNVESGRLSATLQGARDRINSIAWSSDSALLAAGGGDIEATVDTSVRVWRIKDELLQHTFPTEKVVLQIGFSPDDKVIVVNEGGSLSEFWSLKP